MMNDSPTEATSPARTATDDVDAAARAYFAVLLSTLREKCKRECVARAEALRCVTEPKAQLVRHKVELEEQYKTVPTSPILPLSYNGTIHTTPVRRTERGAEAQGRWICTEGAVVPSSLCKSNGPDHIVCSSRMSVCWMRARPPDRSAMMLTPPMTPLPLPPTPLCNRMSTPESPTPQSGPAWKDGIGISFRRPGN
jgi:hypothetical protein